MTDAQEKKFDEMHDSIVAIEAALVPKVRTLEKVLFGNGKPGLKSDLQEIRLIQEQCPARSAATGKSKAMRMTLIFNAVVAVGVIFSIYQGMSREAKMKDRGAKTMDHGAKTEAGF